MINLVKTTWALFKSAFSADSLFGGLKIIGGAILNFLLFPIQKLLELIELIPGIDLGSSSIAKIRADFANIGGVENQEVTRKTINAEADKEEARLTREESIENQNVNININDKTGNATVESDGDAIPVNMSSTQTAT